MQEYDSTQDTNTHINIVRGFLAAMIYRLEQRRMAHDASKLNSPEKEMYDEFTPKLRAMTYGSEEYKSSLAEMGTALQHHYENNTHHPEHFSNGVNGMSLLDLMEMLADWKAAGQRHADGIIAESMKVNKDRFHMSDQLYEIFQNTLLEMGW